MAARLEQLTELLQQTPGDSFLHHALALELIKTGATAAAKEHFLFNLKHHPGYLATYYHLGKLEEKEGNTGGALQLYEQGMAVANKQNDLRTYNELQAAYEDLA